MEALLLNFTTRFIEPNLQSDLRNSHQGGAEVYFTKPHDRVWSLQKEAAKLRGDTIKIYNPGLYIRF